MKVDDYDYHECVCRRKRSTRIMWAKRPLAPNTPASAIIHIHLATRPLCRGSLCIAMRDGSLSYYGGKSITTGGFSI